MVEPQPSKLMTRVRFPSPAPEKTRARYLGGIGLVSLGDYFSPGLRFSLHGMCYRRKRRMIFSLSGV